MIHLEREHLLSFDQARELAKNWAEQARLDYAMTCKVTSTQDQEFWVFERPGADGQLTVYPDRFELSLELGFLLKPFESKIEEKIQANLVERLAQMANPSSGKSKD